MKRALVILAITGSVASSGCGLLTEGCKTLAGFAFEIVVTDARTSAHIENDVSVIVVNRAVPSQVDTLVTSPTQSVPIAVANGSGTYDLRFERPGYLPATMTRTVASTGGDCPMPVTQNLSLALTPIP